MAIFGKHSLPRTHGARAPERHLGPGSPSLVPGGSRALTGSPFCSVPILDPAKTSPQTQPMLNPGSPAGADPGAPPTEARVVKLFSYKQ